MISPAESGRLEAFYFYDVDFRSLSVLSITLKVIGAFPDAHHGAPCGPRNTPGFSCLWLVKWHAKPPKRRFSPSSEIPRKNSLFAPRPVTPLGYLDSMRFSASLFVALSVLVLGAVGFDNSRYDNVSVVLSPARTRRHQYHHGWWRWSLHSSPSTLTNSMPPSQTLYFDDRFCPIGWGS